MANKSWRQWGTLEPSQCNMCKWFKPRVEEPSICSVFPQGIPSEISYNRFDHRLPYDGDGGIGWEPVDDTAVRDMNTVMGEVPGVRAKVRVERSRQLEEEVDAMLAEEERLKGL